MSGFSVAVYGAGNHDAEILYRKQFSVSGAGGLEDSLPDETKKLISDMEFSISSTDSLKSFDTKKILSCLMELAAEKSRAPFPAVIIAFGIMLLCALTGGAGLTLGNGSYQLTLSAVGTIGVCMAVIDPVCGIISSAGKVIQGAAGFMAPLFCCTMRRRRRAISAHCARNSASVSFTCASVPPSLAAR